MTLGFDDWINNGAGDSPMSDSRYAIRAWRLIQRKPASITILRGANNLSAQTVRVEYSNSDRQIDGESGAVTINQDVVVFGVKSHPDEDVLDTDIQKSDIFDYNGQTLRVRVVKDKVGGIEAHCEAVS